MANYSQQYQKLVSTTDSDITATKRKSFFITFLPISKIVNVQYINFSSKPEFCITIFEKLYQNLLLTTNRHYIYSFKVVILEFVRCFWKNI